VSLGELQQAQMGSLSGASPMVSFSLAASPFALPGRSEGHSPMPGSAAVAAEQLAPAAVAPIPSAKSNEAANAGVVSKLRQAPAAAQLSKKMEGAEMMERYQRLAVTNAYAVAFSALLLESVTRSHSIDIAVYKSRAVAAVK
jgi:hypothetical protein